MPEHDENTEEEQVQPQGGEGSTSPQGDPPPQEPPPEEGQEEPE